MPLPKALKDLFAWKLKFLKDQIDGLDAKIASNEKEIKRLKKMKETGQQIESLEHINEGLQQDEKVVQEELDRFNAGGDGKKFNMAKRNIENKIHQLQVEAEEKKAAAALALKDAGDLKDIIDAAAEAMK